MSNRNEESGRNPQSNDGDRDDVNPTTDDGTQRSDGDQQGGLANAPRNDGTQRG